MIMMKNMMNMMKMMIMKIIMNPQLKNLSQMRIIILPKGFQKTEQSGEVSRFATMSKRFKQGNYWG